MDSFNSYQEATIRRGSQSVGNMEKWGNQERGTPSVRWQCPPSPGRKFRSTTCILTSGFLSTPRSTTSLNGPTAILGPERGVRRAPGHQALQGGRCYSCLSCLPSWSRRASYGSPSFILAMAEFQLIPWPLSFLPLRPRLAAPWCRPPLCLQEVRMLPVSTSPSLALKGCLPQLVEPSPLSASCQDQHLPEGSECEHAACVRPGQMATHWVRREAEMPALQPPARVFLPDWASAAHPYVLPVPDHHDHDHCKDWCTWPGPSPTFLLWHPGSHLFPQLY